MVGCVDATIYVIKSTSFFTTQEATHDILVANVEHVNANIKRDNKA